MPQPVRLGVAHTWDGHPLAEDEQVRFDLSLGPLGLEVSVEAPFHADPPPPLLPGSTPRLWEHEAVELFVLGGSDPARPHYTELELGPHGHYLALRLEGVRQVVEQGMPLDYEATIAGRRWTGRVVVPWKLLPEPPYCANAYAVHGVAPQRSYCAMIPVPGPAPDFHTLGAFVPIFV